MLNEKMVKVVKNSDVSEFQKQKQKDTTEAIQKIRTQSEEEQASRTAAKLGLPYVDINIVPIDSNDLSMISKEDSEKNKVAVIYKDQKRIRVAITDPENPETENYLKTLQEKQGKLIEKFLISGSSFAKLLSRYEERDLIDNLDYLQLSLSGKDLEEFEKNFKSLLDLKAKLKEVSTTESINIILAGAIKMRATDIHFEPQDKKTRLRYRIDGVLQDIGEIPPKVYSSIVSRIKMMSEMKLNIRDIAQDGHFNVDMEDENKINVRVNIIPSKHGESAVLRILDQSGVLIGLDELGLTGEALEQLKKQTSKPEGIVLTTGPTGSGKTTTLYSLINSINTPNRKIITIENPIEYELPGISQTQVSKNNDYTFAKGLRAILRQDPDVILVGEIRDEETAETAVDAALTGHLVLSTLHTNSAAGSAARLLEMGTRPSMLISASNAFVGQRLVRKLCDCKEEYIPAQETIQSLKNILSLISPNAKINIPENIKSLYKPVGCPKCHNLGYHGRIGIYEVLSLSKNVEEIIMDMGTEKEITAAALENGMITMTQDGIIKAIEGSTSMEEIWRVTGQMDFLEEVFSTNKSAHAKLDMPIAEE